MKKRIKVAVAGTAGRIGYAMTFRIASGQMFGPDTELELQLLELEQALGALGGIAMELEDCAAPQDVRYGSDVNAAMRGVNWALLNGYGSAQGRHGTLGSASRQRGHLLRTRPRDRCQCGGRRTHLRRRQPCQHELSHRDEQRAKDSASRFFAMTALDELRARAQLAKAGVDTTDISQMVIWGNHSTTQYPDFANARIGGRPAEEVIADRKWLEEHFIPTVQNRGAEVIQSAERLRRHPRPTPQSSASTT